MTIGLGIDTSFDDTAVAVVRDGREILANLTVSQFEEHAAFGGVIPERASRLHVQMIHPLLDEALERAGIGLDDLDFVAVTHRPGLVGSLLVGVTVAKALALALGRPLVGVDHLEAHVYSAFMADVGLEYPFLALLISGANTVIYHYRGHRDYDVVGATLDDAAGECIDKCGRHLGLPMPAGPALQTLALEGDASRCRLARPMIDRKDARFSFSGLKTSVLYRLRDEPGIDRADVAAGLLDAIADVLTVKTLRCARALGVGTVVLCGGAAANLQIREAFDARADDLRIVYPGPALCTDNAAMVAGLGYEHHVRGEHAPLSLPVSATATRR